MTEICELEKDGFKTVWTKGANSFVHVDVFFGDGEEAVLEWAYPIIQKVMGVTLTSAAGFWLEQAVMQARSAMRNGRQGT